MHKPSSIKLSVDSPCHQSWDNMQEADQGRFCSECRKTVIDFTTWSNAALYQFFSKSSGNVCGRFLSTQLNKPINIPHQPHSRLYRLTIALGLTLICTQTPAMLAQNRPPKAQQLVIIGDTIATNKPKNSGSIQGKIVDEKKEPLLSVTVMVYQGGELKGGNVTDYDGNYIIQPLAQGEYDLLVTYVGYDSETVKHIIVEPGNSVSQNVNMRRNALHTYIGGYVVTLEYPPGRPLWPPPTRELTAEIFGRVTDAHGDIVSHVEVEVYQDNILKVKRVANANGEYDITKLKPGLYDFRIFSPGYEVVTIERINLPEGKTMKDAIMSHAQNSGTIPEEDE